jgi:hypothetical protein
VIIIKIIEFGRRFVLEEVICEKVGAFSGGDCSIVCGEHIFKPELECIAVLVHYLGRDIKQECLVAKMVECDFHLDAIEKVKALSDEEFSGFLEHLGETLLNEEHGCYVGQDLLEEFKECCSSCDQ